MTQDEIDTMWQQAMRQSIEEGEMFTRYHFAKLVAAKATASEREDCAKVCEQEQEYWGWDKVFDAAKLIRARGEQA